MVPKMITHIFIVSKLIYQVHRTSVTHGFLAGILLCNSGAYEGTSSVNAPITHMNCLGINFQVRAHLLHNYTRELFPNYLCNHFGPHSTGPIRSRHMGRG